MTKMRSAAQNKKKEKIQLYQSTGKIDKDSHVETHSKSIVWGVAITNSGTKGRKSCFSKEGRTLGFFCFFFLQCC